MEPVHPFLIISSFLPVLRLILISIKKKNLRTNLTSCP